MQNEALKKLSESTLIVCGIVRDCGKNLKNNIRTINRLCDLAKDYRVVIYENDSKDNTKHILTAWADERKKVHVSLNDFDPVTIPPKQSAVNPVFSAYRNGKMASYRNRCWDYIEKENLTGDYVIVVDLDVKKIDLNGVVSSFAVNYDWDAITANGISRSFSSRFRKRYHDTYALVACGRENIPQTEESIKAAQYQWAFLKPGMPLIRVVSAFGGLAIYKKDAIAHCRYGVLLNNDEKVESRAEHFFFYQQMKVNGFDKIYINPAMQVKYQTQVINTIRRWVKKFF